MSTRCRAGLFLLGVAAAALPAAAHAQSYGTDNGACDRGGLGRMLSPTAGNVVGTAGGAAAGGLLGSQFGKGGGNTALTIAGVLAGALAGGQIGRSMEPVDQACIGRTLENAPNNQTVAWHNPDSDSSYWVTPTQTYEDRGRRCRNYTTDAVVHGRREQVVSTSCRQPDGTWKVVDRQTVNAPPPRPQPYPRQGMAQQQQQQATMTQPSRIDDTSRMMAAQMALNKFGANLTADGAYGPKTQQALTAFQASHGLQTTGYLDQPTLTALNVQ